MGNPRYAAGFALTLHPDQLTLPLGWRQPRRIFVNSMSDLFHEAVPDDYLRRVFDVMREASWHVFQILTKRASRLAALAPTLPWPAHIWQGVSVETVRYVSRIADLRTVPSAVRFLSIEPLLGPIPRLPLAGIHWVIVGGESGGGRRAVDPAWVRDIRDQCVAARVPFFFKQWGGIRRNLRAFARQTHSVMDALWGGREWRNLPSARLAAGQRLSADEAMSFDRPWVLAFRSKLAQLGFVCQDEADPCFKNDKNVPMYHLLFFSKDVAGLRIWRGIKRIAPGGQRTLF
jgi:protein gp37